MIDAGHYIASVSSRRARTTAVKDLTSLPVVMFFAGVPVFTHTHDPRLVPAGVSDVIETQ